MQFCVALEVIYQEGIEQPITGDESELHERAIVTARIQPVEERDYHLPAITFPDQRRA
jgi:hypothetical protein